MPIAAIDAIRTIPKRIAIDLPDFALPDELPSDPIALTALMREQQAALAAIRFQAQRHLAAADVELADAQARITYLYEQIVLARHRMFGASSEQSPDQVRLFDEAEVLAAMPAADAAADTDASDDASDDAKASKTKARGKRAPLPAELARVDIIHELPEDQRVCACGTPMVEIGEEISEQLDIVPMKIQVLRHIRKRYGCPDADQAPVTAPMPVQPIPKSNASPELIAMLLAVKYIDGLPLARFEKVLARYGVTIARQTLARRVIAAAQVLQPVHNLLRDALFDGRILHMDETTLQVLKETGRPATSKSYMWVQTGGPPHRPVVIYDYNPSRGGNVPMELVSGFQGFLMTDGYEGYNALARTEGIEHQVCWAHYLERRIIWIRRVTVCEFASLRSTSSIPDKSRRRAKSCRRVEERTCRSHCAHRQTPRPILRVWSGAVPSCPGARCMPQERVRYRAMAAMPALALEACALRGGIALRGTARSVSCQTFLRPGCLDCWSALKVLPQQRSRPRVWRSLRTVCVGLT